MEMKKRNHMKGRARKLVAQRRPDVRAPFAKQASALLSTSQPLKHTGDVRSSEMRDLSRYLIAYEARGNKSSETKAPAAFHVGDKLRPHLATFMGNVGFYALLSRALALANAEVAWLRAVHVKADGSLEGLDELEAQVDPEAFLEGKVVLLAQLLGVLVVLIGENLTLRMVREVWPKQSLNDLDFGKGDKDEKAK